MTDQTISTAFGLLAVTLAAIVARGLGLACCHVFRLHVRPALRRVLR